MREDIPMTYRVMRFESLQQAIATTGGSDAVATISTSDRVVDAPHSPQ